MRERQDVITETYETMLDPELQLGLERVATYWEGKSLPDVVAEMPFADTIAIDAMRDVKLVEIEPEGDDNDPSRTLVVGLPYLNGYTPHHYIRAKTLQLLVAPQSSVWIMPNSVDNKPAYEFTAKQKEMLARGDIMPLGEVQTMAFEKLAERAGRKLGALSLTGYSQGALTVLAMGATNSMLNIERINADEPPSKTDRTHKQLKKDFLKSSSLGNLRSAVSNAEITALSQAMNIPRLSLDLLKFGINSQKADAKLLHQAMTGSADALVERSLSKGIVVKLGSIAGSCLFDPASISTVSDGLEMVHYNGPQFNKHATGDTPQLHALMAEQGLRRG